MPDAVVAGRVTLPTPDAARLEAEVRDAARAEGLGSGTFGVLRTAFNAVLINAEDGVVARVPLLEHLEQSTGAMLDGTHAAARAGAPVLPPLRREPARLRCGRVVTFWPLADDPGGEVRPEEMGRLAAALHAVVPPGMRRWEPFSRWALRRQDEYLAAGAAACALPATEVARLVEMRSEAVAALEHFRCSAPDSLVHGDLWPRNVVRRSGRVVLCDFDSLGRGPKEADLAAMNVHYRRSVGEEAWDVIIGAYPMSYDPELLSLLVQAKEVSYCYWMAFLCATSAAERGVLRREYSLRVHTAAGGDPGARWADI